MHCLKKQFDLDLSFCKGIMCIQKNNFLIIYHHKQGSHRNSKTQFHDFSMIFYDQCNFHDYLMQPTSSFSSNFTTLSIKAECSNNSMIVDRPCIHFEIIETWNHQLLENWLSDTSVRQLVFWQLVVSSNYITKFHDFSMIIQVFFKFHDFSMHGTFFSGFPGFPWFPELVGTLHKAKWQDLTNWVILWIHV